MKCKRCGEINPAEIHTCSPEPQVNGWPLYSGLPQREWQGLTDDQMFAVLVSVDETAVRFPDGFRQFAKAIEAKLKEKNT